MNQHPFARWILVLSCSVSLLVAQQPAAQILREKAVAIPIGNPVSVKLVGKEKVKGQLVSVSEAGLTVRTVEGGQIKERAIAFDQIKSLDHKKDNHTGLKILAGVGITFIALVIIGFLISD